MGGAYQCKEDRALTVPPRRREEKAVVGCRDAVTLTHSCARRRQAMNVEDGRDAAESPHACRRGRWQERTAVELDKAYALIWAPTSGEAPADAAAFDGGLARFESLHFQAGRP
jgi:hypothetical protein